MKVTAPDGTRWKVGRQWWPERKLSDPDVADLPVVDGGGNGGGGGGFGLDGIDEGLALLAIIGIVILAIFLITTVVIPIIAFTIELLIVIVVFFAGIAGRVLFRKPWTVRARATHQTHRRQIVGFRASGRLRDEMAGALREGRALP